MILVVGWGGPVERVDVVQHDGKDENDVYCYTLVAKIFQSNAS